MMFIMLYKISKINTIKAIETAKKNQVDEFYLVFILQQKYTQ